MSEFHYVRTTGVDGGVDACDGPAIGLDLESLLKEGLPPVKVALEIISALCEILDIADQDGEVHGNVVPRNVFVDETGAISVEGFGKPGGKISPDAQPDHATDLYGLGYLAYRMFGNEPLVDKLPKSSAAVHDDAVIDAVIAVAYEGVPEEMIGDIQWYVAKLMSFDTEDRPAAVDAWRTFIAFANEVSGSSLEEWGQGVIDGEPELRQGGGAAPRPPEAAPAAEEEDLGGPVQMSGPLARGGLSFGGGGAKPGQATAFWSRDQMKAALDAEEPEEEVGETPSNFKPSVGGGAATAFWSMDQMKAMAEGRDDAPRPKRGGGQAAAKRTQMISASQVAGAKPKPPAPPPAPPPQAARPVAQPAAKAPTPPAQYPAISAPGAGGQAFPPPIAQPEPAAGGGPPTALIIGVVVLLLLVCGGVSVLGGGVAIFAGSGDGVAAAPATAAPETKKPESKSEGKKGDTAAPPKEEKVEKPTKKETKAAEAKKEAAKSGGSTSSGTKPATTTPKTGGSATRPSSTRPSSTRPSSTPAPAASGPAQVTFNLGARGKIGCGDGQQVEIDGSKGLSFATANLPVSCMVQMSDGGMWAGLIEKSGTVRCSGTGGGFNCSGP